MKVSRASFPYIFSICNQRLAGCDSIVAFKVCSVVCVIDGVSFVFVMMYEVRIGRVWRLDLEPYPRCAFETRSKGNLHNTISLLQWVVPLVVMNVFELVPDRRRTSVSIVI